MTETAMCSRDVDASSPPLVTGNDKGGGLRQKKIGEHPNRCPRRLMGLAGLTTAPFRGGGGGKNRVRYVHAVQIQYVQYNSGTVLYVHLQIQRTQYSTDTAQSDTALVQICFKIKYVDPYCTIYSTVT